MILTAWLALRFVLAYRYKVPSDYDGLFSVVGILLGLMLGVWIAIKEWRC